MKLPRLESNPLAAFLMLAASVALVAALAGWFLGGLSIPERHSAGMDAMPPQAPSPPLNAEAVAPAAPLAEPPLYFYAPLGGGTDHEGLAEECQMALDAGVTKFIFGVPLQWSETGGESSQWEIAKTVAAASPDIELLLHVNLSPSPEWLAEHPEEAAPTASGELSVSLASIAWRSAAETALANLMEEVRLQPFAAQVRGAVIVCLEQGQWRRSGGYDRSENNARSFRTWLGEQYESDKALRTAWAQAGASLDDAAIPEQPDTQNTLDMFHIPPEEQQTIDFLKYTSTHTGETIIHFVSFAKGILGLSQVYVPYGHSFESDDSASGHFALSMLLQSEIDGFISPVSATNRGFGGTAGFAGPVDSAAYHGKRWLIWDDTRTGIGRTQDTGEFKQLSGLNTADVSNILARNAGAALAHGLGIIWADTEGTGAFHAPELWNLNTLLRSAYQQTWEHADRSPPLPKYVQCLVVIDEQSRFYQQCQTPLNKRLLIEARDAVLGVGVGAQFVLMSDVLANQAPPASVYLFLNAFNGSEEQWTRLHAILAKNSAAAIWLYAPGYIRPEGASADNIVEAARFQIKSMDENEKTGSIATIGGRWIAEGREFGEAAAWSPLVYLDIQEEDAAALTLMNYRANDKPSLAVEFLEEGWASVYLADPYLTAPVLREILGILEEHLFLRPPVEDRHSTVHLGPDLLVLHAAEQGERIIDLNGVYDVQDLLDPSIGWPAKSILNIGMKSGETRILKLFPATTGEDAS